MAMARPARPLVERIAVRHAAAIVRVETGLTTLDPIAAKIAARVVEAACAYLAENTDPFVVALNEKRRKLENSPFDVLAIDPEIDTIGLFVSARVGFLKARQGVGLSPNSDQAECCEIWAGVTTILWRRYLKTLR